MVSLSPLSLSSGLACVSNASSVFWLHLLSCHTFLRAATLLEASVTRACFSVTRCNHCVQLLLCEWLAGFTLAHGESRRASAECDPTHESVWFVPYMGSRFVQYCVVTGSVAFLSYHERNSKEAQTTVDQPHAFACVVQVYMSVIAANRAMVTNDGNMTLWNAIGFGLCPFLLA